ncbi:hypothetical protein SAMN04487782_0435 [Stenotrophomonas maltophilia]|nr:hypothetical protein SAMN04487782_0435 [Stenotrophomonas maltophilia]
MDEGSLPPVPGIQFHRAGMFPIGQFQKEQGAG